MLYVSTAGRVFRIAISLGLRTNHVFAANPEAQRALARAAAFFLLYFTLREQSNRVRRERDPARRSKVRKNSPIS
jgi:hypothetical protein